MSVVCCVCLLDWLVLCVEGKRIVRTTTTRRFGMCGDVCWFVWLFVVCFVLVGLLVIVLRVGI